MRRVRQRYRIVGGLFVSAEFANNNSFTKTTTLSLLQPSCSDINETSYIIFGWKCVLQHITNNTAAATKEKNVDMTFSFWLTGTIFTYFPSSVSKDCSNVGENFPHMKIMGIVMNIA